MLTELEIARGFCDAYCVRERRGERISIWPPAAQLHQQIAFSRKLRVLNHSPFKKRSQTFAFGAEFDMLSHRKANDLHWDAHQRVLDEEEEGSVTD